LAESGQILPEFLCKSYIIFYFVAHGRTALAQASGRDNLSPKCNIRQSDKHCDVPLVANISTLTCCLLQSGVAHHYPLACTALCCQYMMQHVCQAYVLKLFNIKFQVQDHNFALLHIY